MQPTLVVTSAFLLAFFTFPERGSCVVDLYSTSGTISSPNYPIYYPNNYDNTWVIHVSSGYSVTLTFTSFDLESGYGCPYDYVEVREGSSSGTSLTGKLCGTDGLNVRVTSTSSLYVRFKTDSSGQGSGFRAQYSQTSGSSAGTYCTFIFSNKYCTYGCCYNLDDCCTSSSSSWSSWSGSNTWSSWSGSSYSSYVNDPSVPGWVIAVIVIGSLIGLAIVISIIVCIVKAVKASTVTTVHPGPAIQPSVAVVSSPGTSTSTTTNGTQEEKPPVYNQYGPPPPPSYVNPPA